MVEIMKNCNVEAATSNLKRFEHLKKYIATDIQKITLHKCSFNEDKTYLAKFLPVKTRVLLEQVIIPCRGFC